MNKILLVVSKFLSRSVVWGLAVIAALFIFVQFALWGGVIWLNTSGGQDFLQSKLGESLEGSQYSVKLTGFSFGFPTYFYLGGFEIYKGETVIVDANSVSVTADMFPLSEKILKLKVKVGNLVVNRPEEDKSGSTSTFPVIVEGHDLPDIYFKSIVTDVYLRHLSIHGEKSTSPLHLSPRIIGNLDFLDQKVEANFLIVDMAKEKQKFWPHKIILIASYDSKEPVLILDKIQVEGKEYNLDGNGRAAFKENGHLGFEGKVTPKELKDLSALDFVIRAENAEFSKIRMEAKGKLKGYPVISSASVDINEGGININDIKLTAPELFISGALIKKNDQTFFSGEFIGKLKSLGPYQNYVGLGHKLENAKFKVSLQKEKEPALLFDLFIPKYGHDSTSLSVHEVTLQSKIIGDKIIINSLSMGDQEGGTLRGSGHYTFEDGGADLNITAKNFHGLKGATADGVFDADIKLSGTKELYKLEGNVSPERIVIKLPERFSQSIPSLNIQKEHQKGLTSESMKENVVLDLLVDAPKSFFVRGWGLDTEFGGKVEIKETLDDPKLEGSLSLIRGRYNEFGKTFKLSKAKLIFSGSVPPYPKLDILAETKVQDIKAQIFIEGTATEPKISFGSVPSKPEDEVLSYILFGKTTDTLSPFQAVQLAQSLQRFSGNGNAMTAFDPLGALRSVTGLDDLRVELDEEGEATVGAGKYLSDKVYLEFETGQQEGSGNANIEVEVTPNITIESEVGQDAKAGAGVFWKWDY